MTKEQERARARRRLERQQARLTQQAAQAKRTRRIAAVAAVVLVAIAVFVYLAGRLRDDDPDPTAAAPLVAGCTDAPSAPGTASELDKPDAAAIAAIKGKTVTATLSTNCGDIVLELDATKAPATVASFEQLARNGYWKAAPCHRLTTASIFVLQCGDPTGTGQGDPGYGYGVENAPADGFFPKGTVAMARTADPETNGGQFFIVYKDTTLPTDTGGYTIFGKVTAGMDMVERIAAAGVDGGGSDGQPKQPISTLTVTTEAKD